MATSSKSRYAFFMAVIVGLMMSVRVSDSASVPISSSPSTIPIVSKDDIDLELLASSKILMDHTSSSFSTSTSKAAASLLKTISTFQTFHTDDEDVRLAKNLLQEKSQKDADISSASSGTDSTLSEQQTKKISSKKAQPQQEERQEQFLYSSGRKNERNSYEMSSPLHVARCRATCLQKFSTKSLSKNSEKSEEYTSTEELLLLPLLRLRKRRSSSEKSVASVWSCQEDSSDCLTCWQTCELFEPRDNKNKEDVSSSHSSSALFPQGETNEPSADNFSNDSTKKQQKTKQSHLTCSSIDPKQCLGGCEVACSFYKHFSIHTGESDEKSGEQDKKSFKGHPVIATKHESVVQIVPGKITWPSSSLPMNIPVVYVVIQEYPDRKWRQIAQTTETSIDIPTELTSAMNMKLRSVRVLVVGTEGLLSVYSPETVDQVENKAASSHDKDGVSLGNGRKPTTTSATTPTEAGDREEAMKTESNGSSPSVGINDHLNTDPVDSTMSSFPTTMREAVSISHSAGEATPSINNDLHVEGPFSFELRVVSLIHQKSLVIAELKWDEIGSNPREEYLITWELTGGGLKGHLVTDSTSVTLSLWPDTTYQIQVEQFLLNLDSDGEQPEPSSASIKSLPLIVDTSEAGYPMEKPSALLSISSTGEEEEENEDDYENEDVSFQEKSATVKEEENHKSFKGGFLNMTLLLAIAISALIFVLSILSVAAFTWTKMRKLSSDNAFNDSTTSPMITPTKNYTPTYFPASEMEPTYSSMEPEPLLSKEDFYWEDYGHVAPVYYTTTIPTNHFSYYSPYDKKGFSGPTVSVISTPENSDAFANFREPPCSYMSYFRGVEERAANSSSNMAYSLLNNSTTIAPGAVGYRFLFDGRSHPNYNCNFGAAAGYSMLIRE